MAEIYPDPPILAFLVFLAFFVFRFPSLFLGVLPLFSKDFRGSAKRKTLAFFRGFPLLFFQKSKGWRVRVSVKTTPIAKEFCDPGISPRAYKFGCVLSSPELLLGLRSPPTWQRSQNPPRLNKSKKSLRESLWGSLRGSWSTPQNESKTSLLETL